MKCESELSKASLNVTEDSPEEKKDEVSTKENLIRT